MTNNPRVSLFDLWLELFPISDEFRRSLHLRVVALAQARRDRIKNNVDLVVADNSLSNEKVD
jgi:hypothetical protein